MLLLARAGGTLDSRLWEVEGGVRGRVLVPEMALEKLADKQNNGHECVNTGSRV